MDKKTRQAALDNISPEDLKKIEGLTSKGNYYKVDESWLILAEFAMAFGWEAYMAVKEDRIQSDEMYTLLEASRKINDRNLHDQAQIMFMSIISAKSKRPGTTFKKMSKSLKNNMKADEE